MAIRLVVYMEALPGREDDVVATYGRLAPSVREEQGCIEFELHRSIERPGNFVLLERWLDQESLSEHGRLLRERNLDLASIRSITKTDRYVE